MWSFNFFFYNRRAKRVVYFAARGVPRSGVGDRGGSRASPRRGARSGSAGSAYYNSDGDDGGGGSPVRRAPPRESAESEEIGLAGELELEEEDRGGGCGGV